MTEWTSLKDILQDLSVAQGFMVPAALEIFSDKGPPALNIDEEEIEEESYYESGRDGQHAGPDFKLIQEMLKMVKNKKDAENDNKSDLDPLSPVFVPQIEKNKIKKNVAISSIIAAQESVLAARRPVPKNVIPMMFKRKNEVKSNSVSSSQMSLPGKRNRYTPTTLANEYYNKYLEKSELRKHYEEDIWSRAELQMKEIDARKEREGCVSPQEFAPEKRSLCTTTTKANECCNKYFEKSELKKQYEEDIWSRAEQQMKEIEAKNKRRAQLTSPRAIGETESLASFACGLDKVSLPEHRHELFRSCVVCNIVSKHGFIFEEDRQCLRRYFVNVHIDAQQ